MLARLSLLIFTLSLLPFAAQAAAVQLPATGQTICWDAAGAVIDCAGTGHDGEVQAGVPWPVPRFVDNGDGTLTDRLTDLVWLKDADCLGNIGWQQALDAAKTLATGACGLGDGSTAGQWRVPNRRELFNIAGHNASNGGTWLNSQGFVRGRHLYYWTSDTALSEGAAYKWIVQPVGAVYPESMSLPIGPRPVMFVRDPFTYAITTSVSSGGSIACTPDGRITRGGDVSCSATPAAGYHIASVTVDGVEQAVADPVSFTQLFQGVTADHAMSAAFTLNSYTVSFVPGANGTVSGSMTQTVEHGGSATAVTAAADTGYHFVNWTGPDGFTATDNPLTVANVTADTSLTANFAIDVHAVTPFAGENGAVQPAAPVAVNYGDVASFTVTPASGYLVAAMTGCGGTLVGTTYTTAPVTADCAVTATFAPIPPPVYDVSGTSADNRGSITCTGEVVSGRAASCTISPRPGFQLATLTDNGVDCLNLATEGTYRIENVTGNHIVTAGFAANNYPMEEIISAYRSIVNGGELPAGERTRCDIAPLGLDGRPAPDGVVDVADLVILLRKLVGVVNW